jgi:hypothetical protein
VVAGAETARSLSIEIFDRRHRKIPFVDGIESTQIAGDSARAESRALSKMGANRRTRNMKAKTAKPAAKAPAKKPAAKAPAKKPAPKKKK